MTSETIEKILTLFIYYKIPSNEHQHYLAAVRKLKQAIESRYPSVQISQQKRPELDNEKRETWMETYHGIPHDEIDSFTVELTRLAELHGLPVTRKHEVFATL